MLSNWGHTLRGVHALTSATSEHQTVSYIVSSAATDVRSADGKLRRREMQIIYSSAHALPVELTAPSQKTAAQIIFKCRPVGRRLKL